MTKNVNAIESANAPKPIGPYSQAVKAGDFTFISGQIGLSPAAGQLAGNSIVVQAGQALANIQAILESAGLEKTDLIKVEVYLKDIADFSEFNGLYSTWLGKAKPARQTMQVAKLPMDALVEISAIAYGGK